MSRQARQRDSRGGCRRRIEVERRLADVLAAAGFDQAVDGVVGVVADRLDLLAVVEDRLQRMRLRCG